MSVFLLAGLLVLTAVGALLAVAQRQAATAEAIRDARSITHVYAEDVVGPVLTRDAFVPGPARDRLDRIVRNHVLGTLIVRVKIWDESGLVLYSDDADLVGRRFELPEDELKALRGGDPVAEVSDLDSAENTEEAQFGRLLQVYEGITTESGQQLLFETYQPYDTIRVSSRRTWLTSLPILVGGLALLYLVQAPLAYRMATRLRAAQDEREQLLLATLAAADRERTRIASDLHDGVVQGLTGASYTLTAAAGSARAAGAHEAADAVGGTATSLRHWVRELRSLIVTVTPPTLHSQGLRSSLTDLVATLQTRGLDVRLDVQDSDDLDDSVESLVYRVAQEAVRNVVKHADASRVDLTVHRRDRVLELRVADDGTGFDPRGTVRHKGSVGLELLQSLVAAQGGVLEVASAPGSGTVLTMQIPAAAARPASTRPSRQVVR